METTPPSPRSRSRRWTLRLGGVAGLLGLGALLRLTAFAPPPVPVRTVAVERGRVEQTVTNTRAGTVKARRRARISPEVGGRVVALPHPEGSRVRTGDVILKMDDVLSRARLAVAERETGAADAQREQSCLAAERAERERSRTEELAAQGILSTDLLDQVASAARTAHAACRLATEGLARARAAQDLARADLEKTVVRAPFDAVVAEVSTQVGEWTTPSPPGLPIPPVIDVIDTSSLYVSAPMDEVDSARLRVGLAARVTVDSHPGRSFPGRVVRVAPYVLDVEAQNRTVEIEVELDEAPEKTALLAGTSADVEVILSAREGVLRVPSSAVTEGTRVLVRDGGRLAARTIVPGIRNWDFTEVASGLAEGERVVTSLDRPEVKAGARAIEESVRP
jgi:HlyD family secretion protein